MTPSQVGRVCVRKNTPTCGLTDADPCWCYVHDDCSSTQMCSGTGRCVTPVIEVRNEMEADEAEFRVYSTDCTAPNSANVDTYGASPWGRVDDLLFSHGLCSHRNWWEYNETMSKSLVGSEPSGQCNRLNGDTPGSWCEFDTGDYANSWSFSRQQDGYNGAGFAEQGVMWQEAHTCDRDYMHMRNMRSCHGSPSFTWWKGLANGSSVVNPDFENQEATYLGQGSLIRTYRVRPSLGGRVTTRIGVMRHVDNPFFGFLGKGPVPGLQYRDYTDFKFTKCNTIMQCFPQVHSTCPSGGLGGICPPQD